MIKENRVTSTELRPAENAISSAVFCEHWCLFNKRANQDPAPGAVHDLAKGGGATSDCPTTPRSSPGRFCTSYGAGRSGGVVGTPSPGNPADGVVVGHLYPDREAACRLQFPSERS
jgi:hypothetical protein